MVYDEYLPDRSFLHFNGGSGRVFATLLQHGAPRFLQRMHQLSSSLSSEEEDLITYASITMLVNVRRMIFVLFASAFLLSMFSQRRLHLSITSLESRHSETYIHEAPISNTYSYGHERRHHHASSQRSYRRPEASVPGALALRNRRIGEARRRRNQSTAMSSDKRVLAHLHIGKNAGTSLEKIAPMLARQSNRTYLKKGNFHYDWSFLDSLHMNHSMLDVITMLRHPVNRAVSHFYFGKTLPWTRKRKMRRMSLSQYLNDTQEMMRTSTFWTDGQAATFWLTGAHPGSWVQTDSKDREERVAYYHANVTKMLELAADRLDQTLWFGLVEDLPRSMKLLQHVLKLPETPTFPKSNRNSHPPPTDAEKEALASLMPRDLWVYEYGKRLFEARFEEMETGVFFPPERPPIPKSWSCIMTQSALECNEGPYKGIHEREVRVSKAQE